MKTALKIIGLVIILLVVIAIAVPFLVNVNSFRPEIESKLSGALGRQVKVGNLSLSILSGSVGADQLAIADDSKFSNALEFGRIRCREDRKRTDQRGVSQCGCTDEGSGLSPERKSTTTRRKFSVYAA